VKGPLTLIGTAWIFARKQPSLAGVTVWLLLLPGAALNMLSTLLDWNTNDGAGSLAPEEHATLTLLAIVGLIVVSILMVWGGACVIVIGRKLVHSPAGRKRTSIRAIMQEARVFIIPLLLTGILRSCFALLWSLLLIIPGIIYSIRTTFYTIVVVTENMAYRDALKRSSALVRGLTWQVLWRIAVILIVLFGPVNILSSALYGLAGEGFGITGTLVIDFLDAAVNAPMTALSLLASMAMYDELKKA
jgi:uncharacterized membrane protein